MKAFVKVLLILGGVLVVAGGVVLGVGLATRNSSENSKLITTPYEFAEEFTDFDFNLNVADLEFKASEDGKYKVECVEKEKLYHEVKVENHTLTVVAHDTYQWYEKIFGFNGNLKVTVSMPSGSYNDLKIESSTGNIKINKDFSFHSVNSKLSTGNTTFYANVEETLELKASTGNIVVEDVNCKEATFKASTGNLELKNLTVSGSLTTDADTGNQRMSHIRCKNLSSTFGTGNITLQDVIADEKMSLDGSTGDVRFDDSDAHDIEVHTSTGDVTGTILTGKIFDVRAHTGKPEYPSSTANAGFCLIETHTGRIRISVKGA
ncbi:MAG: DUF4097 family beta strand repeat protein [Bacilli bacterium]|nr:DUF4097 family beta strand repeat protein [Bacilli bacterium]